MSRTHRNEYEDVGGMLSAVRRKPKSRGRDRVRVTVTRAAAFSSWNFIHIPLAVRKLCEAKEGQRQEKPSGSQCAKAKAERKKL